jgi:hypothetical protein
MNYLKYAIITTLILLQACNNESCSSELYNNQDKYFFSYNRGRLYKVIDSLLIVVDEQDRNVISLRHFDKLHNLFHGASVGGEHTFESYFPAYGGLSRDNLSIHIKFEVDSVRLVGEASIDSEFHISNSIIKIRKEAANIWEDRCLMNSKLTFVNRMDDNFNNAYFCDQKITMTLTLNENSVQRVFKDSNLLVFYPSEHKVPNLEGL